MPLGIQYGDLREAGGGGVIGEAGVHGRKATSSHETMQAGTEGRGKEPLWRLALTRHSERGQHGAATEVEENLGARVENRHRGEGSSSVPVLCCIKQDEGNTCSVREVLKVEHHKNNKLPGTLFM